MLKEFKEFAMRSNVVDLAVGIIIGAAFSTIVKSQVDDIIMPPFGVLTGGVDFSNMFISLNGSHYDSLAQARQAAAPTLNFPLSGHRRLRWPGSRGKEFFARPAGEGLGMPNTSELANISTVSHISEQRCLFFVLIGSK